MKKFYRIMALMLVVLTLASTLCSCGLVDGIMGIFKPDDTDGPTITLPHQCDSKCHKCGKCLDASCTEAVCKDKCQGHNGTPAHTCESACPECGKCLDAECNIDVCADKCAGHHKCESVCEDCGKCLDYGCSEDACADKCMGHTEDEAKKAEAYNYFPVIREEMAAIYINTPDGDNSWATKYNKNDKLAGRIDYVDATINVGNCEEEYVMTDVSAEVKVRGNATLNYVKKPIRIKFSKKANLLGLHDGEKYKNWVLLADWKDLSMSNNTVAFYLGNTILGSDGYYCTDFRNVEVYLNGQYWGMYLLVEQQEVKDGRTSVPEVPEEDDVGYTGNDIGYFFEYDGYYGDEGTSYLDGGDGDPTFTMTYPSGATYRGGIGYTVKSDLYASSQLEFLRTYMNNAFYIAFQATKGSFYKFDENYNVVADTSATNVKNTVRSVIDIQSLVDVYILNEIACDLDVDWSSFYLSLDMSAEGNKKVTFEAPWDWDSCFGLRNDINNAVPNAQGMYASTKNNPWFRLVTGQEWFWEMVREKWAEMKKYGLLENTIKLVQTEKETYKDYYIKNYTEKWSERVTQGNGECNATLNSFRDVNTAQGLAADWLIDWLTKRLAYLDSQWAIVEIPETKYPEAYEYMPTISETLPVINIVTPDGDTSWATKYNREDKINGRIDYVDATITVSNCEDGFEMADVAAEVKVRGNYTLEYPKKPIRIKFSKKANLLGLHDGEKYKNWVLLADWKDLSMSNNSVAFYLGNTILGSDGYYCTDFRNVEVYLNGQYWGMYLLVEQQEVKDGRTSVPEVPEEDDVGYTGNDIGYFFEYDGYYYLETEANGGDPTFTMSYPRGAIYRNNIGYTVKSDIYADSQLEFLRNYMNNAFYIAFEATKGNYYKFDANYNVVPDTKATNAIDVAGAVIDIQSLVDIYILNEIACDLDVDWSSFYISLNMSAEGNKKVTFEAPWDWDSCFGLRNGVVNNGQGMYAANSNNPWFRLFSGQEWFWEYVRAKWNEMKEYGVLDGAIELVKTEKETYKDYYIKNYSEKWSQRVYQGNDECNGTLNSYRDVNTAQGLAADFLISWLTKRFAYLDDQWGDGTWGSIKVDENLPANSVAYKYEAENAVLGNFSSANPIRTDKDYASGRSYVGNVAQGTTITFTVTVSKDTTVYLFAGVSKRSSSRTFPSMFSVTVNGAEVLIPDRNVPGVSNGEEEWHTFISVKLAPVELKAGTNTIVFTTVGDATNFDYIEIYSAEKLS